MRMHDHKHKFHGVGAATCLALLLSFSVSPVHAQDGRPEPEGASPSPTTPDQQRPQRGRTESNGVKSTGPVRAEGLDTGSKVQLAFKDVSVEETIPFIVEATGKVVMPVNLATLRTKKITLVNDQAIERSEALDLLFTAFRLNRVGVIERDDVVIIGTLEEVIAIGGEVPVIGANVDIMERTDRGTIVLKIFEIQEAAAEDLGERLKELMPDFAKLTVDPNSNQIVLLGDIALCQLVQNVINRLDSNYVNIRTQTFKLKYADAAEVSENILDLFEVDQTGAGARSRRVSRSRRAPQQAGAAATPGAAEPVELRTTVNGQQNSVTVSGEPSVVTDIAALIQNHWDQPRSVGTSKVYKLQYTDPIKVRDTLEQILGSGGGGARGGGRTSGRGAAAGAAGGTDVASALSGIYQFEAYPDTQALVVLSKTVQSFDFLDNLIMEIDQPAHVGIPAIVELKHANAVSLAQELNALLSEAGGGASIDAPSTGLTGEGITDAEGGGGGGRDTTATTGQIDFPWQRGRPADDQAEPTPLIGKIRIVPIVRQNALAIVAPPAYIESMRQLIIDFDQPARQVMIEAIIAEVNLTDALQLGLRLSSDEIVSTGRGDNAFRGGAGLDISDENFFGSIFTTSILDVNFNVNAFFQALNEVSKVRVLQRPRIFTADNQEAIFFDGQDVPFITTSQTTDEGALNESFDYRPVGVALNVRPRITAQRDVDLEINLELSSIVPGQTLFGGFILDRRQTSSEVIIKDNQTIVLSGILRDEESEIKRKVPLLGDIPLLGELFTSRDKEATTTELLVFITPKVVANPSASDGFFEGDRERLGEISRPLHEQTRDLDRISDEARNRIRAILDQSVEDEAATNPPVDENYVPGTEILEEQNPE